MCVCVCVCVCRCVCVCVWLICCKCVFATKWLERRCCHVETPTKLVLYVALCCTEFRVVGWTCTFCVYFTRKPYIFFVCIIYAVVDMKKIHTWAQFTYRFRMQQMFVYVTHPWLIGTHHQGAGRGYRCRPLCRKCLYLQSLYYILNTRTHTDTASKHTNANDTLTYSMSLSLSISLSLSLSWPLQKSLPGSGHTRKPADRELDVLPTARHSPAQSWCQPINRVMSGNSHIFTDIHTIDLDWIHCRLNSGDE